MSHLHWNCCHQVIYHLLFSVNWKLFSPYLNWPLRGNWYYGPSHLYYNFSPQLETPSPQPSSYFLRKCSSVCIAGSLFLLFFKYWCSDRLCPVSPPFTLCILPLHNLISPVPGTAIYILLPRKATSTAQIAYLKLQIHTFNCCLTFLLECHTNTSNLACSNRTGCFSLKNCSLFMDLLYDSITSHIYAQPRNM